MNNLNKKQKIILGILITIVLFGIWYYVYAKEEQEIILSQENLEVEENTTIEKEVEEAEEKEIEVESNIKTILVHISGAVKSEGLVELQEGDRVADAIEKAGGLTEEADTELLNLASKLEDGMKVHVLTKEEKLNSQVVINQSIITNQNTVSTGTQKVNINAASQTELETLPGIGPSIALSIINYRKENGNFKSIEQIKEVSGIGENKYNKIKEMISIN